jgi:putative MATE family efflux protein
VAGTPRRRRLLGPEDRAIAALAVPAFATLVAEPLFLLADAAIVGHLGRLPLAGLGIAGALLASAVGVCVFLAYGTTATVGRRLGAGDVRGALATGVDGLWLALGLGAVVWLAAAATAPLLVTALGASPEVAPYAVTYLRWSLPGLPAMLVVLAATGVLRGLQDTRTPLYVAAAGAAANAVLNWLLVYPLGLGIAGSGLGTAIAQLGMGAALAVVVVRAARAEGATLRPHPAGIRAAAAAGVPLVARTLLLRAVLLVTTYAAARTGDVQLAAHQVVMTIWTTAAFALDAVAIAGQALTGRGLGRGDTTAVRAATRRMTAWGIGLGVALTVGLLAVHRVVGALFTEDPDVRAAIAAALLVLCATLPLAGYVFVLDGVLIGAGDGRYLAVAMLVTLVAYLPIVAALLAAGPGGTAGLVWLWVAFTGGFMGVRAVTLGLRARSDRWMVVGALR